MAQVPFRVNLLSSNFPWLSELQGRTVIIPQLDMQKARNLGDIENNLEIPEIYYGHNIIPTSQGYQSIAYRTICTPPADTDGTFSSIEIIRDASGNKAYLGSTTSGRNYILKDYLSGWIRTTDVAPATTGGLITAAFVSGVTYIYYEKVGCYVYDFATNILGVQVLTGLVANTIKGLVAAKGFLIAFGDTTLSWSNLMLATDFVPSIITGAGGGAVQDLQGTIISVEPFKYGFLIGGSYNLVVGTYTGNIRYPFTLTAIIGSGGISDHRYITTDPVSGDNYVWSTSGLQLATSQVTNAIFPDITDFIGGSYIEDFNETTKIFSTQFLSAPLVKKLSTIVDRYITISYGVSQLTHVILYDSALRRFGKLRTTHIDCFEYLLLGSAAIDSPRNSMGFLQQDGTIQVASFSTNAPYASGVIILGKFQLSRNKMTNIQEVSVENVRASATFSCDDMYSLDGKTLTGTVSGYLDNSASTGRTYKFNQAGMNHSLLFMGEFNLSSMVMRITEGGYR